MKSRENGSEAARDPEAAGRSDAAQGPEPTRKVRERIREAAATTFSAAEAVQQLYMGYPVAAQILNEDDEEATTSLYVDRRDPLDDPGWTIGEEPKGS